MFSSIRTRLTFSYLAIIVVAMGLSGFLLLSLLERYFLRAMESSLAAQAQITAQALIPGATAGSPPVSANAAAYNTVQQQQLSNLSLQAQNIAPPSGDVPLGDVDLGYLANASLQLSSQLDSRIRILDTQGVVLVDSQQQQQGEDLAGDALVAQALSGRYATGTEPSGHEPAMRLALPVLINGKLVGAVYLSQPLNDLNAVMSDLRLRWLVATLVALLFSGLVGLLLSGAVSRPLRRLTAAAGAVARGRLDQQVPVRSRDELGRLSQAFNEMTGRLRAARQTQVDFVANVSHELRTPLTAVKGLLETLRDGAVDDPQVRDHFLETVESETDRLIRLVNDLLTLSRADSEALNLRSEPTDLGSLAQAVVQRLGRRAEARQVLLRVQSQDGGLLALADRDRVEQVLVNLLDNAVKYSRPGGTVTIAVEDGSDGMVRVRVSDEGVGISSEDLPRVGERFYRADKARSRAEGGSGLGLAIAQALAEAQGGRLWLESEEGRGTVVTFTLPVSSP
jgi:signal transduction histidine kinase